MPKEYEIKDRITADDFSISAGRPYITKAENGDCTFLYKKFPLTDDVYWELFQQYDYPGARAKAFVEAFRSNAAEGISSYKLRVSINPDQLKEALDKVLIPELLGFDTPITTFKVIDLEACSEDSRLHDGGQITLYLEPKQNIVKLAEFIYMIHERLAENRIVAGMAPNSDFVFSPYISGRCDQILSTMLGYQGAATSHYVAASEEVSEDTLNCFLFHFLRLFLLAKFMLKELSQAHTDLDEKVMAAKRLFVNFHEKYDAAAIHDHDMIVNLVKEILIPLYELQDKRVEMDAFLLAIPKKADYPGYGKREDQMMAEECSDNLAENRYGFFALADQPRLGAGAAAGTLPVLPKFVASAEPVKITEEASRYKR